MTPDIFRLWRAALGLNQTQAGESLEMSRRRIQEYEAGTAPIPKVVALACAAIFHRLGEWTPEPEGRVREECAKVEEGNGKA
jgi:transcriptional regulator with XRE-family HTH domain